MNNYKVEKLDPSTARSPLLLIDDNIANIDLLERMLEWAGYVNVRSCTSAKEGLEVLHTFDPFLVILDLKMPVMDGYEFLVRVREQVSEHSFLPILVFTSDLTPSAKIRALELGASDFLTKPGDAIEIQLKIRNFLKTRRVHGELQKHNEILEAKVRLRTEDLELARREAIAVLAKVSEYRDDDTGQHVRRVGDLSAQLARRMPRPAEDFVEMLKLAAPLHDVGKVAIPDAILHKPGSLTEEELIVMRRHVPIGAAILEENFSPLLKLAREIALNHHERWDGSGYPNGLSGYDIPLSARIVSVADAFDAMTNDRHYRKARSHREALTELEAMGGVQFDPSVVDALSAYLSDQEHSCDQAA